MNGKKDDKNILRIKSLWFSVVLFLTVSSIHAQLHMESLTVADGLSQGFVTDMIQDHRGFIWIATFDGLNRYDGYNIRRFTVKPFDTWALQAAQINCLYEDDQHLIWIGTHQGLYVFEPLKERFLKLSQPIIELPAAYISLITGDAEGNIFVNVLSEGNGTSLFQLRIPSGFSSQINQGEAPMAGIDVTAIPTAAPFANPIKMLDCIGDTLLLAVDAEQQIFKYSYEAKCLQPFDLRRLPRNTASHDHNILWGKTAGYCFRWILPDGRDSLMPFKHWLNTFRLGDGRIGFWMNHDGPLLRKNTNAPLSMDVGRPKLVLLQDPAFLQTFTPLLPDNRYWNNKIIADRQGIIWLGTKGYGVRKINPQQLAFGGVLQGKSVSSLRELPNGQLWVRLYNDESFVISAATGEVVSAPWALDVKTKGLYEVFVDSRGNFWLVEPNNGLSASPYRLIFYEKNSHRLTRVPELLHFMQAVPEKIFEDRSGNIWIAAHRGVVLRFRAGRPTPERFSYADLLKDKLSNLRVTAIVEDANGVIWLGTNEGLLRMDGAATASPKFSIFQHEPQNKQSISMDWISCISPDLFEPYILWLGTRGGGLNRFDTRTNTCTYLSETANGLPDNVVYGILPDGKGKLWCSTNRGLCQFDPVQHIFVTYQESDGLLSTEFNTNSYLRTRDGKLWFGGVSGLNYFWPKDIVPNDQAPAVAISGIKVQGLARLPDVENKLSLPFEENNVMFEFSVLDFANNKTNRYRYRLHGIHHDWVSIGTAHTANFSALPPGRYTFELQGATADSPWSSPSLTFSLEIRPPWYRSRLAWILYAAILALVFIAYLRYREDNFKLRHSAEISQRESERLKAFDAVKNKFFANIAHELRTPLTIILGLAERLRRGEKGDEVAATAIKIIKQGNNLLELTSQVLDLGKLESRHLVLAPVNGNINDFVQQQVEPLIALASAKGIGLKISADPPEIWMDFDPIQMPKILNNLISNAIRHTLFGGNIVVHTALQAGGDWLKLTVSDNGEGISPDHLPHIFERFYQGGSYSGATGASGIGLTLVRELVQMMGGSITVESNQGKGTVFSVLLPVTNSAQRAMEGLGGGPKIEVPHRPQIVSSDNRPLPLLLIIEDNEDVTDYLHLCLYPYFKLEVATDGQTGIDKALALVPDIILTDVAMPVKSGLELASILKEEVSTSHIPIVMLTAKAEQADRIEGHRRGANAYLTKPFDDQELLLLLQNLLKLQQQWRQRYAKYPALQPIAVSEGLDAAEAQTEDSFMQKMYAIFEEKYSEEAFDLKRLCHLMGMSRSQLDRKLKTLTDRSPMEMLRSFRLQKAYALLSASPTARVTEVCFQTGFKNPSHFSRLFAKEFGKPPSGI